MIISALATILTLAAFSGEEAATKEKDSPVHVIEFNAIACTDESTARRVTTMVATSEQVILENLSTDRSLQRKCGLAMMPSGFATPRELAEGGAEILPGEPQQDGRTELIYKVSKKHEQNQTGFDIYIVFFMGDE